jgi:hypothetical protein
MTLRPTTYQKDQISPSLGDMRRRLITKTLLKLRFVY